jgi:hypothetical protein
MNDNLYFEGDPGTDSTRRHMERVLSNAERPRRWPWVLAAIGSGSVWLLWRLSRSAMRARERSASTGVPESRA